MASPAAVLNILLTANTTQANAALAKTQGQLVATGKTATATSATMKKAFLGIGLAAGAAGVALFKVGEEFDDAFDKISTRTGATGREMRKLKGVFRDVVSDVPASFDDAATAVGDLNTRLGLSGRPLKVMSKQMTELARITETDVAANVETVSRAFVDWEVATKDQSKTLDGFYRLSQKSGIAVADIASEVQRFGSPLRQFGFSLEEAASMFASFERAGVNTQTMLPGLKFALRSFMEAGLEPGKALRDTFDGISDGTIKAQKAFEIFGGRATPDMIEAIQQGRFEFDKFIKTFEGAEGAIREQGRRTMDLSEHWTKFKNNLKLAVEPVARDVFKGLGDLMKEVTATFKKEGLSGVLDLLLQKLSDAVPKILAFGAKVAEALVQGFLKAGIWGKLALGAVVFKMLGGLMAPAVEAGATMATRFGAGLKAGLARMGIAAVIVGVFEALTTEGGVIDTIEGEGQTIGKNFAAAVGAGLGPELERAIDKHSIPALRRLSKQTNDMVDVFEKAGDDVPDEVRQMANQSARAYDNLIAKQGDVKQSIHAMKVGFHGSLGDIMRDTERSMEQIENSFGSHSKRGKELLSSNFEAAIQAIKRAIDTGQVKADKGLDMINDLIRKRLEVYGIKGADAEKIIKAQSGDPRGLQRGGIIYASMGTLVPGSGNGDKVPAMLEPGEVVINKKAVAAMGGARKANSINRAIPRFASGGEVPKGGFPDAMGALPGLDALAWVLKQKFGLGVTSGLRPGAITSSGNPSDHGWGGAIDVSNGITTPQMDAAHAWMNQTIAPAIKQMLYRTMVGGNHFNHIHVALLEEYARNAAAVMNLIGGKGGLGSLAGMGDLKLKLPRFDAGFPFYAPAAAGLNNVAAGLEKIIGERVAKSQPTGGGTHIASELANTAGPLQAIARRMIEQRWGEAQWPYFNDLVQRESGWDPSAVNPTSGAAGLAQALPPSKYPPGAWPYTGKESAIKQLQWMVGYVAERYGTPAGAIAFHNANNWYKQGGIVQKLARGGIGGSTYYPGSLTGSGVHGQNWTIRGTGITAPGVTDPGQFTYTPGSNITGVAPRPWTELPPWITGKILGIAQSAAMLEEQISNAEILHAFASSEMGTDLGPLEKAAQIALNDQLLATYLEAVGILEEGTRIPYLNPDTRSSLVSAIQDLQGLTGQGGKILTVRQKLDQLGAPESVSAPDTSLADALKLAEAMDWAKRYNVSQAQYAVLAGMPVMHDGGVVPGATGASVPIMAQAGEYVSPAGGPNVNVIIEGGPAMAFLKDFVRVEIDGQTRKAARGRPLPGVRG